MKNRSTFLDVFYDAEQALDDADYDIQSALDDLYEKIGLTEESTG